MTAPILAVERVSRRFGNTPAIEGISFTLQRGQVLGIIGRSGAGKSTLLRCLNGLDRPDEGRVLFEGAEVAALAQADLRRARRRMGMIFQHFNLLSAKTALGNVALPLKLAGVPRAARRAKALALLDLVGIAGKADAYPAQLSGGQKQRVGIARALACDPALLLCDEATSALDPETTFAILELLRGINRRLGLSVVLITHEMNVARRLADRVLVLASGRVVEEGPAATVLQRPAAPETRLMLRAAGFLPADTMHEDLDERLAG